MVNAILLGASHDIRRELTTLITKL
jgi:hypothetical protein